MTFHFSPTYLLIALALFAVEICIAVFVNDRFVRPLVGDLLVVILVYCVVRIFVNADYRKVAVGALLFACLIELLQYFDYVKRLGLENNPVLSTALGRTFEWLDLAAYTVGFLIVLFCEKIFRKR